MGDRGFERLPPAQRLIDDRRVFARMELALVNDLAEIGAVLQHQVAPTAMGLPRNEGSSSCSTEA